MSMTPRLVAVDMDGTFLDDAMNYDRARFAAIHDRMATQGIRFVVASGNQYFQLRSFFPDYPETLYVAENGAFIGDAEGELLVRPMDPGAAAQTWRALGGWSDLHVVVCGRRSAYVRADAEAWFVERMRRYCHRLATVPSFEDIVDDVCKVTVACTPEHTDQIVVALGTELAGRGVVPVSGGNGAIDLIAPGVNKGAALLWLGERLGIEPAEMVAFGDGGNDLEMLEAVGLAVAMPHASPRVRDHADAIAESNNGGGVLTFLEAMLAQ
ncbi:MAG: Cof-type HAD-IIB family hydrolase [Candidatus Nanopelagicales bacterium]